MTGVTRRARIRYGAAPASPRAGTFTRKRVTVDETFSAGTELDSTDHSPAALLAHVHRHGGCPWRSRRSPGSRRWRACASRLACCPAGCVYVVCTRCAVRSKAVPAESGDPRPPGVWPTDASPTSWSRPALSAWNSRATPPGSGRSPKSRLAGPLEGVAHLDRHLGLVALLRQRSPVRQLPADDVGAARTAPSAGSKSATDVVRARAASVLARAACTGGTHRPAPRGARRLPSALAIALMAARARRDGRRRAAPPRLDRCPPAAGPPHPRARRSATRGPPQPVIAGAGLPPRITW